METHLAFRFPRARLQDGILIPKYYDPELAQNLVIASEQFELPELRELLNDGDEGSRLGSWVPREYYGTGEIPYVRTSDLSQWRIRPDFKKGVSTHVYEKYGKPQDIRVNDLLMVAHGTYLVGTMAIVTTEEPQLVLQDHVFRLRPNPSAGIDPWLLLALLSTNFVKRQVRSRQFSADIIDKIGDRHLGLRIPVPRSKETRALLSARVKETIEYESSTRKLIRRISSSTMRMTRERAETRLSFTVPRSRILHQILIPKYYDPGLERDLADAQAQSDTNWVHLGDLISSGILSVNTGVEVGKMAYGTGPVPFIRTTDLADWELKHQPRQGVSDSLLREHRSKASVQALDILLVRDGTYLVGSSALVAESDLPALFCGGIFRLRVKDKSKGNPYALLAFLNLPIVRRQMRARQFTRDVIDTLGYRLYEVKIPPIDSEAAAAIAKSVEEVVSRKAKTRLSMRRVVQEVEPKIPAISAGRPGWSMR